MQASDGDATSTNTPSPLSLPKEPELVRLTGTELLLHNSAYRRGQGEGLAQGAAALRQAIQHIEAQENGVPTLLPVKPTLESVAEQLEGQSAKLSLEQNVLLGEYIVNKRAAEMPVQPPLPPKQIGWVVKAYRWAFAR